MDCKVTCARQASTFICCIHFPRSPESLANIDLRWSWQVRPPKAIDYIVRSIPAYIFYNPNQEIQHTISGGGVWLEQTTYCSYRSSSWSRLSRHVMSTKPSFKLAFQGSVVEVVIPIQDDNKETKRYISANDDLLTKQKQRSLLLYGKSAALTCNIALTISTR